MKKIIVILMIAAVGIAAYAQSKTTLNVLYYIDATAAGYADDQALWAQFQQANPNINLVKEELFNEPFHQKVAAYIASGQLPDIVYAWPSGRSTDLHKKGLLRDLTKILPKSFFAPFSPAVLNPKAQASNQLGMLPWGITYTNVLFVNQKILKDNGLAVPKTYAQLKALGPKLKAKGIEPALLANKDGWQGQSCLFSTVSGRIAGDAFIDNVLAGKAKFTDKPFVDALTAYQNLYKDGILSAADIQVGYGETPALFASGKAAILIDGDWRAGAFITDKSSGTALISPAVQKSDIVLIPLPSLPGEKYPGVESAVLSTGFAITTAVKPGSDVEKAAIKFFNYWYGVGPQTAKLETGAYIPAMSNVKSNKVEPLTSKVAQFYTANPKTSYVLDGVLDAAVVTPINNGLQALGLGTETPAQVASEVQAAFDTWKAAQ